MSKQTIVMFLNYKLIQQSRYDADQSSLGGMRASAHRLKPRVSAYACATKLPVYKAARGTYDLG